MSLSEIFADLGVSPLSNSFLKKEDLVQEEPKYPLVAYVCSNCFLVQLQEFEKPENIFHDYAYFSSFSDTWLEHSRNYVEMITRRFRFDSNSLVVEIASNDGYLLQYFKEKSIPILGIEPAENVARVAEKKGIPTLTKFFNSQMATDLAKSGKQADLIIGNNILAHVPQLNDFISALKIMLKPKGLVTLEFPHLLQLVLQNQFDTIYHEHFSYFSLNTIQKIFSSHGLVVFDVEEIPTHGGSLRIYCKHPENHDFSLSDAVNQVIKKEAEYGLTLISTYTNFAQKIKNIKKSILEFFYSAQKEKRKIVCYGAAAKGNTLLNYCEISSEFIEYAVDRNPHKQGLYLPGSHIPIKDPNEILKTKPDYLFILPWNLKDEIVQQMSHIRQWGGKFVTPIPRVVIHP